MMLSTIYFETVSSL